MPDAARRDAAGETGLERDAAALIGTLARLTCGSRRDTERQAERLRFALARVEELRRFAEAAGGATAPGRLEATLSILATQVEDAQRFLATVPSQTQARPPRFESGVTIEAEDRAAAA